MFSKTTKTEARTRRDSVKLRYHNTTASGWNKLETFAHNRKQNHLDKIEKLNDKIARQTAKMERDLAKQREEHEKARAKDATDSGNPRNSGKTAGAGAKA